MATHARGMCQNGMTMRVLDVMKNLNFVHNDLRMVYATKNAIVKTASTTDLTALLIVAGKQKMCCDATECFFSLYMKLWIFGNVIVLFQLA